MIKRLIFCFCFCISLGGYAQQKYEREYRIDTSEVPQEAMGFIKYFNVQKKVKWYQERGLDSTSVEAKFKLSGFKYSIEFSNDGSLQDIEQTVPFISLQKHIQKKIRAYLKENYDAYDIEKVQHQYTGNTKTLLAWRQTSNFPDTAPESITHIYELIVRARTKNKVKLFEFQFDEKGQKIEKKEVITRDTDILKF